MQRTCFQKTQEAVWPFRSIHPPAPKLSRAVFSSLLPSRIRSQQALCVSPFIPARMAALLRTAAALAPRPSPARESPRRPCAASLACSRRPPVRSLRAQLLTTRRAPGHVASRLRRLGATEADESAQTATQVRGRILIPIPGALCL